MKIELENGYRTQFYSNRIIVTLYQQKQENKSAEKSAIMLKNQRKEYNGFMSNATERKCKKILSNWIDCLNHYKKSNINNYSNYARVLVFLTLTLSTPQKHDDNFIKRNLLNNFLIQLKKKKGIKHYFWKAEKQQNGNIHFHLITDCFLAKEFVQNLWNQVQDNYGYLDDYRNKFKKENPPSTQIQVYPTSEKSLNYMLKYALKNDSQDTEKKQKVQGRIWNCSDGLRNLKTFEQFESGELISKLEDKVNKGLITKFEDEYFLIYNCDTDSFLQSNFKDLYIKRHLFYVQQYKKLYFYHDPKKSPQIYLEPEIKNENLEQNIKQLILFDNRNYNHFED